jgi:hypothetical protein
VEYALARSFDGRGSQGLAAKTVQTDLQQQICNS